MRRMHLQMGGGAVVKTLDEKGFVFLDSGNRPYMCALWNGEPWLFYWHKENKWVSLRKVSQTEIWGFFHNLSEAEQQIYHDTHVKNMGYDKPVYEN